MPINDFNELYAPPSQFDDFGRINRGYEKKLLDWLSTNHQNAQDYIRMNRGWRTADLCMAILYGDDEVKISKKSGLSRLSIKKLRRQAREQIANHTTVAPRWGFRTYKKDDEKAVNQAKIYTDLLNAWFFRQFVDKKLESTLTWTEGAGTGYLFLWPEKDILTGEIDIIPQALSHKQVLPFHYPSSGEYQKSYGLSVRLEMPVPEAHEKFPHHTDIINKDRDVPSSISRTFKEVRRLWRGVVDRVKHNKLKAPTGNYPTVDIFFTWIRDNSINTTGSDIQMGEKDSHYGYLVPSYYDNNNNVNKIKTGTKTETDEDEFRDVTIEDCKLYPKRRLIVSCSSGILYDGAPFWGGKLIPVVPFKFEEVVGELLGISPIEDGRQIEQNINMLVRSMIDSTIVRKSPPMGVDERVPKTIADKFDPSKPNQKIRYNMQILQNAFKVLVDSDHYQIDTAVPELVQMLLQMQDYVVGTSDWQQAAMRLKQLPASDTQESLIQSLGVLATAQSRGIEKSLMMLGLIWAEFAPQVFTNSKIMSILGDNGIWQEFDYDPNNLVPYKDETDDREYYERFCEHIKKFSFYCEPTSLQEKQSVTNRLALLQIKNSGVKISNRKIYDAFIRDGQYDESLKDFYAEQEKDIEMAAKLNAEIKKAQNEIENPVASVISSILGNNNGNKEGRPPTNSAQASLEQKTDESGTPRTTLATS